MKKKNNNALLFKQKKSLNKTNKEMRDRELLNSGDFYSMSSKQTDITHYTLCHFSYCSS